MSSWDILLQQIINGVSLGAMYSLLALGFTMVYGIIELILSAAASSEGGKPSGFP